MLLSVEDIRTKLTGIDFAYGPVSDAMHGVKKINTQLAMLAAVIVYLKEQNFKNEIELIKKLQECAFQYDSINDVITEKPKPTPEQTEKVAETDGLERLPEIFLKNQISDDENRYLKAAIALQTALSDCKDINTVRDSLLAAKAQGLGAQEIRMQVRYRLLQLSQGQTLETNMEVTSKSTKQSQMSHPATQKSADKPTSQKEQVQVLMKGYVQAQREDPSLRLEDDKTKQLFAAEQYANLLIKYKYEPDQQKRNALKTEIDALGKNTAIVEKALSIIPKDLKPQELHKSVQSATATQTDPATQSATATQTDPAGSKISGTNRLVMAINIVRAQNNNNSELIEATKENLKKTPEQLSQTQSNAPSPLKRTQSEPNLQPATTPTSPPPPKVAKMPAIDEKVNKLASDANDQVNSTAATATAAATAAAADQEETPDIPPAPAPAPVTGN